MPRVGLDGDRVVDAAAELIDADGADALSLSALAQRLGVRPPSLYAHVDGLEDLRRRLAARAAQQLGDVLAPAAAGLSRGEALAALGRAYRDWALAHPGLYAVIATDSAVQAREPAVERALDLTLAVLRGYGLEGEAAVHAARSVRAALHGFITLERAGFGIPVDAAASFEWMLAALDRGLASGHGAEPAGHDAAPTGPGPARPGPATTSART